MNQPASVIQIAEPKTKQAGNNGTARTAANATAKPASGQSKDSFAAALLVFEGQVRSIQDEKELLAHWCNSTRRFLPYRQAFLLRSKDNARSFSTAVASGIAVVDRNVPFIRWIEKVAMRVSQTKDMATQLHFSLADYSGPEDDEKDDYPFLDALWTPVLENGRTVGGFLTTREQPWNEGEDALATRMTQLYVHSWGALKGSRKIGRKKIITPIRTMMCCALLALLGMVPLPITALAPVEVVASEPFIVAAPFDGVVKEILVEQGQPIVDGNSVVAFDDVRLSNERDIANQREMLAKVRFEKASQSAIADHTAKRELAVAKSEYELAKAESTFAQELLDKTRLHASSSGVAIYTDKRDWTGKPVSAGEAIMQIADPQKVRFSIDLPVKDSLVLKKGARVKVFLDSDPLKPLEATLTEASYQARADKRDILSYTINADLDASNEELPRIGVQGTAQVFGEKAPLIYVVLRRPLAALRQFTGW